MIKTFRTLILIVIIMHFLGCGVLTNRDIDCRDFTLTEELYWPSESLGDPVKFYNQMGDSLEYRIVDKVIEHRTNYVSDTGCGCLDISKMLLTNAQDSIWFILDARYIEDQEANSNIDFAFVSNGTKTILNETIRINLNELTIGSTTVLDLQLFQFNPSGLDKITKAYLAKDLGIIRFEKNNGEVWTNANLTEKVETRMSSFDFTETTCN